ncbi:NB-ARC domain-containing protein [Nostoc carneum NIES-2107]|nr:NB-ARC domain-containing protein [Nostoc carneum NIES-2107]
MSIQRLSQTQRAYFTWLGVLAADANITPKMAATLWDMASEGDALEILEDLHNQALLLPGAALADGTKTYRLHESFHNLALQKLTAPTTPKHHDDLPGLGISLVDAHAALLAKYRQQTHNHLWHTLPDDGYIHQHLAWHLEKAGLLEEIHSLLREESQTGGNGWFEAREKLAQTRGYIADISRAWELVQANWQKSTPQVVGLQCRYALIMASINSLPTNIPAELVVALVKNHLWTAEQGLASAQQHPKPEEKARALAELVKYLPPNLTQGAVSPGVSVTSDTWSSLEQTPIEVLLDALAAVRAIASEFDCTQELRELAPQLPAELLPEALAIARMSGDEYYLTHVLSALAEKLPTELLSAALATAKMIQKEYYRAKVLIVLAQKLPEVLPAALTAARVIEDGMTRAEVLIALVEKLPPELLPEALTAARETQEDYYRAEVLIALAQRLPELLPEALAATEAIRDESCRGHRLSELAEKLPPELLPEVLAIARKIQNHYERANALIALVEKLPEVVPEAIAAARETQNEYDRAEVLIALAQRLPELLPEAIAATEALQNQSSRVQRLSELAEKLPPELLPEVLTAAREIQDDLYRVDALIALVQKLPEILPEALATARTIEDEYYRADALIALAEKLPHILPEALATAKAIEDEYHRAHSLSTLIPKLPPELLPEALAATRAIEDESRRVYPLSALVEKVPQVLPEALACVASAVPATYFFNATAFTALASSFSQLPAEEIFPLWQDTLHQLSLGDRPKLLEYLAVFSPVIWVLGGQAAIVEVIRAIYDVVRWWQ